MLLAVERAISAAWLRQSQLRFGSCDQSRPSRSRHRNNSIYTRSLSSVGTGPSNATAHRYENATPSHTTSSVGATRTTDPPLHRRPRHQRPSRRLRVRGDHAESARSESRRRPRRCRDPSRVRCSRTPQRRHRSTTHRPPHRPRTTARSGASHRPFQRRRRHRLSPRRVRQRPHDDEPNSAQHQPRNAGHELPKGWNRR